MAVGDSNPSRSPSWSDEIGHVWHRKGKRTRGLSETRTRSLLDRDDVPLVVWESFETYRYDAPADKVSAASALRAAAASPDDVVAHEWTSEDGRVLLMLEHLC